MDESLKECADYVLKKTYKKRIGTENNEVVMEKPWFTEEIRTEIKKKKELNKKKEGTVLQMRKEKFYPENGRHRKQKFN